jgi:hypothetical protein
MAAMDAGSIERKVVALAARQHGVVTRAQALALGFTARMVEHRAATGRWLRLHPGVYAIAGAGPDPQRSILAACLYLGRGAVASHRSAAWLWQLSGFADAPPGPELLVPVELDRRQTGLLVHRTDRLDRADVTTLGAIPITRVERTLLDLGAVADEEQVELARDDALRRGLITIAREGRRLDDLGGRGRRGTATLRAIRRREIDQVIPRSELERLILNALRRHRIPVPVREHPVLLPSGRTIYLDHSWPDHEVVLEVLGRRWHAGRKRWVRDVTRGNEATSVGWRVMTATQEHLDDGGRALAGELRHLLALTRPRW